MNKAQIFKWSISALFISAMVQVFTGVALFFELFASKADIFEAIARVHKYNGPIFIILVMIHLGLNWGWVKANFLR